MRKIFLPLLLTLSLTIPLRLSGLYEDVEGTDSQHETASDASDRQESAKVAAAKRIPTLFSSPQSGNQTVSYGAIAIDDDSVEDIEPPEPLASSCCSRITDACLRFLNFRREETLSSNSNDSVEYTHSFHMSKRFPGDEDNENKDKRVSTIGGIFDYSHGRYPQHLFLRGNNSSSIAAFQAFRALANALNIEKIDEYPILSKFLKEGLTYNECRELHLELRNAMLDKNGQFDPLNSALDRDGVVSCAIAPSRFLRFLLEKNLSQESKGTYFFRYRDRHPNSTELYRFQTTSLLAFSFKDRSLILSPEKLQKSINTSFNFSNARTFPADYYLADSKSAPLFFIVEIDEESQPSIGNDFFSSLSAPPFEPVTLPIYCSENNNLTVTYQPCAFITRIGKENPKPYTVFQRSPYNNNWYYYGYEEMYQFTDDNFYDARENCSVIIYVKTPDEPSDGDTDSKQAS